MSTSADNIATFVDVVRHRSLSAAARSLGLPKSTISRRLIRLEAQLQNKLLQRDARKITLTAAGRRFYDSVVMPIDALAAAVSGLEQSSREPRGTIRLTAPSDLGRMVLAPMLVAFLERHPEIALDLVLTNRRVDLLQEGIDLALRAGPVGEGSFLARKLCDSSLQLAASARHGAKFKKLDIRALALEPFVLYGAAGRTQTIKLERSQGRPRKIELSVSGRISVDDYATLAELVAAGQGIGLLPAIHLRERVDTAQLIQLLPEWSSHAAQVHLLYPSRQKPQRVQLLIEFLFDAFAKQQI
ncbi:MAG TPA: LysR substrate-binding domain-containing protein [Polyangiales bacterium]|jgi:DNA-binding transcriptional LysR family regulator